MPGIVILDLDVRDVVLGDPFDALAGDAVAQPHPRRAGDARGPRDRPAVGVQAAANRTSDAGRYRSCCSSSSRGVGELDRHADGFGDLDRLGDERAAAAAAVAAAHVGGVHRTLSAADPTPAPRCCAPGRESACRSRSRRRRPRSAPRRRTARAARARGTALRTPLRSSAGDARASAVDSRRGRSATAPGFIVRLANSLADAGARQRRIRPFVPLDLQRAPALHRRPGVGRDDRDALRNLDHVRDAGHRLRLGRVEARDLAAEHRAARDHRVEHVRAGAHRCRTSPCR